MGPFAGEKDHVSQKETVEESRRNRADAVRESRAPDSSEFKRIGLDDAPLNVQSRALLSCTYW